MQLTCSTSICPDLLLPQALDFVKKAGFEAIELFRARTASTPLHPDLSVPMVRRHLREAGIQLTGHNIRTLTGRKPDTNKHNHTHITTAMPRAHCSYAPETATNALGA